MWNDHHAVYEQAVKQLIGAGRVSNESYVTEFMPYLKQDWIELKQKLSGDWKTAIEMPIIYHVNQLEQLDWSQANVVKFKARPLKGMREQDAHRIIDYFKRITA